MSNNKNIAPKIVFYIVDFLNPANFVFFTLVLVSLCIIFLIGLEWTIIPSIQYKSTSHVGGVLLNLSYSFMAAFFFWFCTEYTVEQHRQSKTLTSCQPLLDELTGIMSYMKELMILVEEGGKVVNKTSGKNGYVHIEKHYNIEYNSFVMGLQKYLNGNPEYSKVIYSLYSFPAEILHQFNLLNNIVEDVLKEKERLPKYLVYLLVSLKNDVYLMHLPVFLKTHLQQPNREVGFNLPGKIHTINKWIKRLDPYVKTCITYKMTKFDNERTNSVIREIKNEMFLTGDIWKKQPCLQQSGLYMYPFLDTLIKEHHETINHNN